MSSSKIKTTKIIIFNNNNKFYWSPWFGSGVGLFTAGEVLGGLVQTTGKRQKQITIIIIIIKITNNNK